MMKTPYSEFLDLICETAEKNCNLDTEISTKELPAEGGLYAELGEEISDGPNYDKGAALRTMPVLFLCRNVDQIRCIDQLSSIGSYLQALKVYPQGKMVAWKNAVAKAPRKIGRDEDGKYYYSLLVNCLIYF